MMLISSVATVSDLIFDSLQLRNLLKINLSLNCSKKKKIQEIQVHQLTVVVVFIDQCISQRSDPVPLAKR